MGKRRLAYTVGRFHDGIYILLTVEGSGGLVHELERRLRVTEPVIKFLSVRIDEEQKRLDKIKEIREERRKAAPPVTPAAEAGGEAAARHRGNVGVGIASYPDAASYGRLRQSTITTF